MTNDRKGHTMASTAELIRAGIERRERIEDVYVDLKLRDRLTPGRTPWQRLREQAESIVDAELELGRSKVAA